MRAGALLLLFAVACKVPVEPTVPYSHGLDNIKWGSTRADVDSILGVDSSWMYVSSIINSTNGRQIVVLQKAKREYYLEFDDNGRLFLVNYIDDQADLDSTRALLSRHYGKPVLTDTSGQGSFVRSVWQEGMDDGSLELELLVTKKSYSFVARRKW